ncbi:MAG: HD domain-containing phosphohydrolase [Candidatus Baltobacteraceae bacterium]
MSRDIPISEPHREHRDRELIRRAATLLAAGMSLGELFERLCEMLADYIDSSVVFIALVQPDGSCAIEYFHDHGEIRRDPHITLVSGSITWKVIHESRIIWGNRAEDWVVNVRTPINIDAPETDDTISAIFVPLKIGESTIGCLSVQSNQPDAYDAGEVDLIAAIARYLAVAVENQRMVSALQQAADIDVLTGLLNHSKLLRELDVLVERGVSTKPVAALLLNVTNFAMFNDTFGYPEGDKVLRRVADALCEFVDVTTILGRYGGDVFLFLLADRSKEQILKFVNAVAERCRSLQYRNEDQAIPITIACGYALAPIDAATRAELLALSIHRARLSRKQGGRAVGEDDIDAYTLHGSFTGIETIVDSLLDRDPYTRVHLFHVNAMAKHWAEYNLDLERSEFGTILQASLLHDVGKLLISDRILVKPSTLTPEEYRAIQHHAEFGKNILSRYAGYAEVAEIVGQHHERLDGLGYPNGLAGNRIHPLARAITILDAFSAMVMDRPYHRGIAESDALAEIERCSGTQFDPAYVSRFLAYRAGS